MAPITRTRRLVRAAAFAAALTVPAAALAYLVRVGSGPVIDFDVAAVAAATDHARARPALHGALLVWQEASQARWVNLGVALVAVWAWRRRGLGTRAAWAVGTLLFAWGVSNVVKYLVQRARPVVEDALGHAPGYSFPSGHSMNAMAAGLVLVLLLWPLLGRPGRVALTTAVGAAVALTGLDRIFLGAHYPSDVLAGFALGAALAGGSYLGYLGWQPHLPGEPRPGALRSGTLGKESA